MESIEGWRLLQDGIIVRVGSDLGQLRRSAGGNGRERGLPWASPGPLPPAHAQDQSFADLQLTLELVLEELMVHNSRFEFGDLLEARLQLAGEFIKPRKPA